MIESVDGRALISFTPENAITDEVLSVLRAQVETGVLVLGVLSTRHDTTHLYRSVSPFRSDRSTVTAVEYSVRITDASFVTARVLFLLFPWTATVSGFGVIGTESYCTYWGYCGGWDKAIAPIGTIAAIVRAMRQRVPLLESGRGYCRQTGRAVREAPISTKRGVVSDEVLGYASVTRPETYSKRAG